MFWELAGENEQVGWGMRNPSGSRSLGTSLGCLPQAGLLMPRTGAESLSIFSGDNNDINNSLLESTFYVLHAFYASCYSTLTIPPRDLYRYLSILQMRKTRTREINKCA